MQKINASAIKTKALRYKINYYEYEITNVQSDYDYAFHNPLRLQ